MQFLVFLIQYRDVGILLLVYPQCHPVRIHSKFHLFFTYYWGGSTHLELSVIFYLYIQSTHFFTFFFFLFFCFTNFYVFQKYIFSTNMDFVGAWTCYMNKIQTNCNVNAGHDIGINQYMTKMKRLLKKKSNLHWHFLQQYICENISPLGLRIQLHPSFQNVGPKLKKILRKNIDTMQYRTHKTTCCSLPD